MNKKTEALKFLEGIEDELKSEFNNLRDKHFNTNTKGYEYEKILKYFLESYLGGLYDFYVRVPLIDIELDALSIFASGENEFDVVGTYKTAVPKIVLKAHKTSFIPYDAVAFVAEVKQTVTKAALENDLKKLGKLGKLKIGEVRFGSYSCTEYVIERPLKILFYYEKDIAEAAASSLLQKYRKSWDLMTILTYETLLGNPSLPTIGKRFKTDEIFSSGRFPLLHLMYAISASLPVPLAVNAWGLFIKLLGLAYAST